MRSGHRRAVEIRVATRAVGREDVDAGRADIDGCRAVVRERGSAIVVVGGRDVDDVVEVVRAGVRRRRVAVQAAVACRSDEDVTVGLARVDRVIECLRESAAAPRVVRNLDTLLVHVLHRKHSVRREAAVRSDESKCHQLAAPCDARHADAVVADRTHGARRVRSVRGVRWVAVALVEVVTERVIDVAVCVVVDAVSSDFAGVRPHVCREIGVRVVRTIVDDRDDKVGITREGVPRLIRAAIGT